MGLFIFDAFAEHEVEEETVNFFSVFTYLEVEGRFELDAFLESGEGAREEGYFLDLW